jgi:hypothetical protein
MVTQIAFVRALGGTCLAGPRAFGVLTTREGSMDATCVLTHNPGSAGPLCGRWSEVAD